jgi:hypothetical protein
MPSVKSFTTKFRAPISRHIIGFDTCLSFKWLIFLDAPRKFHFEMKKRAAGKMTPKKPCYDL